MSNEWLPHALNGAIVFHYKMNEHHTDLVFTMPVMDAIRDNLVEILARLGVVVESIFSFKNIGLLSHF